MFRNTHEEGTQQKHCEKYLHLGTGTARREEFFLPGAA